MDAALDPDGARLRRAAKAEVKRAAGMAGHIVLASANDTGYLFVMNLTARFRTIETVSKAIQRETL